MRLFSLKSRSYLCPLLSCILGRLGVYAFNPATSATTTTTSSFVPRRMWTVCYAASNGDNDDNNKHMNDIRKHLESAWNAESMGEVPTNPESAAQAAAVAVRNALGRRASSSSSSSSSSSCWLVDVRLPQYDPFQGEKLYDEVLAVEFCIALANKLDGKSSIIVGNDKTIQVVTRILDRREMSLSLTSSPASASPSAIILDDKADDDDDDNDEEEEDETRTLSDVDSFRAKLKEKWESSGTTTSETNPIERNEPPTTPSPKDGSKRYRLCSMLGDANFVSSIGTADMQRQVIDAVRTHALPADDEDTLIILSVYSPQELIGIRALAAKYLDSKNIILVNARLSPLPRELAGAEIVYSVLPLVAKAKNQPGKDNPTTKTTRTMGKTYDDNSNNHKKDTAVSPQIVVMRRFPRDWEVFVDTGNGFELAATTGLASIEHRGPSMKWITSAVQRFLERKYGLPR